MTGPTRPGHWSEVLADVADLGAQVEAARAESATAAAEAASMGVGAEFTSIVVGPPPPRQPGSAPARAPAPAPVVDGEATVRLDLRPPTEARGGVTVGPPPPRQAPPRRRRIVPARPDVPDGGDTDLGAGPAPGAVVDAASTPVVSAEADAQAADTAPSVDAGRGRRLLKDNLVVAAGTLTSRITGVGRLFAVYLLASDLSAAYLLANNTPNIIYELILGGILTATLVPLFTQHLVEDDEEATSVVVSVTLVALVALTLVACIVAPGLILLYRQNVDPDVDAGQFLRVGAILSLLFAPQVFFYGVTALGSALLNARRRFFAAAWAPVLNNLVVVAAIAATAVLTRGPLDLAQADSDWGVLAGIGLGTTAGIAVMATVLLPALKRAGVRLRFRPRLRHPAVRAAARLSGWTLGYVIANQVAAQTVLFLAVNDDRAVRSYQVGFMFFQLPHGLLAVSLMTTFQPDLARAFVSGDWAAFHARFLQGLRLLVAVIAPAAIGYLTLAALLVRLSPGTPYEGGEAIEVARAMVGFGPGLLGFSVYLFVLRAFYAVQDTKRPFWINAGENVLNIVGAVILTVALPVGLLLGLTSAYSFAYIAAAVGALVVLLRRLPPGFDLRGLVGTVTRCLAATALMAAAVTAVVLAIDEMSPDLLPGLAVGVVVGVVVYVVAALALGVVRDAGLARRLPGPLGRLSRA